MSVQWTVVSGRFTTRLVCKIIQKEAMIITVWKSYVVTIANVVVGNDDTGPSCSPE